MQKLMFKKWCYLVFLLGYSAGISCATLVDDLPKTRTVKNAERAFNYIEKHASEGVYRLSGTADKIDLYLQALNEINFDINAYPNIDVDSLAVAVKKYILISNIVDASQIELYALAGKINVDDNKKQFVDLLRNVLFKKLTLGKRIFFVTLFQHLYHLSLMAEQTKMTASNLAIVIGPNLLSALKIPRMENKTIEAFAFQPSLNDFVCKAILTFPDWSK